MKNTVRVILFVLVLSLLLFFFRDQLENGVLGFLSVLISLSVIFISFVIFLENRHPTQTITWLVVLGSFPLVGFIFYLLFGRNYRKERMFRKKYFLDKQAFLSIEGEEDPRSDEKLRLMGEHQGKLFKLAQKLGNSPISFDTATKVLTNGEETFQHIIAELKRARHHIHLEYYIVRHDQIGQEIKNILIEKASQGVKVRFMYDAVGSWQLSKSYINELKNAGIETVSFGPVRLPFLNNKFNFRNHRKIIVIDGNIGFVGGLNIGDEYLGRNKEIGFWRDTHLMLRGEAVRTLQLIFLQDWYYMTNHSFLTAEYLSPQIDHESHGGVQLIAGGPDNEWSVIKNIFFSMISSARESVWIASPYFIPDEDIFSALKVAALSGIDVRLLVPNRPDKRIVFHASRSYFPELMAAGVKIFEYERGFMHSKIIIVDGELASIGTSNMDMRSFHLNFEVNAFLFRTKSTLKLVEEYLNDLKHSKQIDLETFQQRHIGYRLLESTARLLSPLL
ncbi:cardiolipin synthase [Neobacillus thermocopriae]|uniref:Cardiolipin synthase n=1 Tax=Neobacillus thermocopriae TaxID=1215031 RepID=A0A6B3TPG7_9BACI|nr:cardiolipin synthase [Neobacillus thermocopriae]MED3623124.1 cardiolipin synthase [Neobacillus thermocopriae]MED3715019.1 cardiolipin synthase [Neobacillus thermocopriae]NEX78874.1 cardiolipin synthase [Neobacillus thermocopriae]